MPVSQRDRWEANRASHLQPRAPQAVRQAVEQHGVKPGIAGDHLPGVPGRRIAVEYDRDFFFQTGKHRL